MAIFGKKDNLNSTLKPVDVIGIKTDSEHSLPMFFFSVAMTLATLYCIIKIELDSFHVFDQTPAGPYKFFFSHSELSKYFSLLTAGCVLICIVNGLKKHSFKASLMLFGGYLIYFGSKYKYISNGFVHVLNKAIYSTLEIHGQKSSVYYLTYFDVTDRYEEIEFFVAAVVLGTCFLLAFTAINRCSPVIFTLIVSVYAALPFLCGTFLGERYFVCAAIFCIILFTVDFQGYSNFASRKVFSGLGNTVKIRGRYVSFSAFQQAVLFLCASIAAVGIANIFYDFSDYRKSEDVDRFGKNLIYSIQNITSNNSGISNFGNDSSSNLNNGDLSHLGDLKYTGETMFEIKTAPSGACAPLYFRSFTAADYNGSKWSQITENKYKSYTLWQIFRTDNYYPQLTYGYTVPLSGSESDPTNVSIVNKNINPKIFLTEYRMAADKTDVVNRASAEFDNEFTFSGFGGVDSYEENIIVGNDILKNNVIVDPESFDGTLYDLIHNGDFDFYGGMYLPDEDEEESIELKEKEKKYRAFVAENYLNYPEGMEKYIPDGFDEMTVNLFDSYLYNSTYIDYNEVFDGYSPSFSSVFPPEEDYYSYVYKYNASVLTEYYDQVIAFVREFLQEKAEYTLSPGTTPQGRDFVEYFLKESHKGYCVHFATASTLMLRRAGIPARYVEGYFVSEYNLENHNAQGYSKIPDSNAHAWTEVYYPLIGWQAVDFTPYYSDERLPEENVFDDKTDSENASKNETETETDLQTEIDSESSDPESLTESDSEKNNDLKSSESDIPVSAQPNEEEKNAGFWALLGKVLVKILLISAVIVSAAALWIMVRLAALKIRAERFSLKDTRASAKNIYLYSLKILKLKGIQPRSGEGEKAFAARAMGDIEGITTKDFENFTDIALGSRFGKNAPSLEEIETMNSFVKRLFDSIYNSSGKLKKLYIKYILFLN